MMISTILKIRNLWIQPAAGDAGGALGCALAVSHACLGVKRKVNHSGEDSMKGSLLGPSFTTREVRAFLDRGGYPYERIGNSEALAGMIAGELAGGKVVGLFSGRMEFGPRALGSRSIIGDPRRPEMQKQMNMKIKYRESFRPFAPSVLIENAAEYFSIAGKSPYMLFVLPVLGKRRCVLEQTDGMDADDLLWKISRVRSDVPAVTHVDYSARVQTVDENSNQLFKAIIEAFRKLTGCGVMVNTSFNVRGEPIVCFPRDAYRCFMRTGMDVLVLEDCVLRKEMQPAFADDPGWQKEFGND